MRRLLVLFTVCLIIMACEKEVFSEEFPEMESFYVESCRLPAVTMDSVILFSIKVNNYTNDYPESKGHLLFPKIQENIKSASFRITIECDTTWDGETHIYF